MILTGDDAPTGTPRSLRSESRWPIFVQALPLQPKSDFVVYEHHFSLDEHC